MSIFYLPQDDSIVPLSLSLYIIIYIYIQICMLWGYDMIIHDVM